MGKDQDPDNPIGPEQGKQAHGYHVDAREAKYVQIGEHNTQIIYQYSGPTWTDGRVASPLVDVTGHIDSPYRGLNAFEERDAGYFFGRDVAAGEVLERISGAIRFGGLLMVSGVSGAGKSSLLRAGVLPRIRGAGLRSAPGSASWPCLLFSPGDRPLDELAVYVATLAGVDAAAVRTGLKANPAGFALTVRQAVVAWSGAADGGEERTGLGPRLLLVIDQFEQLFTRCPREKDRRAFIEALHAAATSEQGPSGPAALVVVVVRADFEARCADYEELAAAVQDRYLVMAMTERQLRMAITEPAKAAGSKIDDELVELLLSEVRSRVPGRLAAEPRLGQISGAGVLPLLSHALDQAWRMRAGKPVTLADYERTGGIEGAVNDSAQRAYGRLTPAQQGAARRVFIRLTAIGPERVDLADGVSRTELVEGGSAATVRDVEAVLERFAEERLLTLAADTVEISHEVLLTAWPLLRDEWLAETHTDRVVRTRLRATAAEWSTNSGDRSYLYTGSLLDAALGAASRISADPGHHPPLGKTEREFLLASERARRRVSLIRRSAVVSLIVLLAAALAATAVAAAQAGTAIRQRNLAARQRNLATSRELASESQALIGADPTLSRLLGLAAWQIAPAPQTRYDMYNAQARPLIAALTVGNGEVSSVSFSRDGRAMETASFGGAIRLWDVAHRQSVGPPLTTYAGQHPQAAFSPDGRILATSDSEGSGYPSVRLWDTATRRQLAPPLTGKGGRTLVGFDQGGSNLVTADGSGVVRSWSMITHRRIGSPLATGSVNGGPIAVAVRGQIVATVTAAGGKGAVLLWHIATRLQIGASLSTGSNLPDCMAFSPGGRILAAGGLHGRVWLWNVATHRQIGTLVTSGTVRAVALSPNGRSLAAGTKNGIVGLWGSTQREVGPPLPGNSGLVNSVAFSPSGRTLAAGGADCRLRLWSLAARRQTGATMAVACPVTPPRSDHPAGIASVAFSPNGRTVATAGSDGTIRLWNAASAAQTAGFHPAAVVDITSVVFSPDGRTLAASVSYGRRHGITSGVLLLAPAGRGKHPRTIFAYKGYVSSLAFSPDGRTLAASGGGGGGMNDARVLLWNVVIRHKIRVLSAANGQGANSVAFGPYGNTLATGNGDGTVRLWDLANGRQIRLPR